MKTTKAILIIAGALLLLLNPLSSKADTVSYTVGIGNSDISGYSPPYAEILVNLTDSTHATITFTSDVVEGNIYLMGDGSAAAVNVNATSFTLGPVTGTNAGTGFSPGPYSQSSGNVDGFGTFNLAINSFDGFTDSADTIVFTLTDTSGSWGSASDVLTADNKGFLAAAHIFVTSSPANGANGALATGYAANGTVPEPGILILLGIAMSAIGIAVPFARKI